MNRSLLNITIYLQLAVTVLMASGCAPAQPFFLNESPDLQYYLNSATSIEYPDVDVESLAETVEALPPLTVNNHDYQFWDLSLEECVAMALHNAKFIPTTNGLAEQRQGFAEQFIAGTSDQFGSVYDIAIQQSTTQSVPLTVDGAGNRVLPRGVLRANQVGGVEDALAEFDAQTSAFLDYQKGDRPNNVQPGNVFNPVLSRSNNVTQQAAISKRTATGGVVTLRQQILYSRNNTQPNSIARSVASDWTVLLEAQIQHPLMRNRGTLINRIPVVLASLNEDISIAEYEIQIRNLVRDVEVAYVDLYVAYHAFASISIGRNSAQVTADVAKAMMEAKMGNQQDLDQAVGQYFDLKSRLSGALTGSNVIGQDRFGVYGRERQLRQLIGQTATDGRLIRPIDELTIARVEHDWFESRTQALYLNAELRQTKFRIKQFELELMSAKNQILPEVNLSVTSRWVGIGDTLGPPERQDVNFPSQGSSALGELTEGNYFEVGARIEVTPSAIGARRELARINGARLRLAREQDNLRLKEEMLVFKLTEAIGKISTHYQQVQDSAQRWQSAESEAEIRLAVTEQGFTNVNVLLQSQQRRADAEIAYYQALGEYNKTLSFVDYLKGTLLINNGITVAEGPWQSKAYQDALERARERSAGHQLQYGVSRPNVVRTGPLQAAAAAGQFIPGPNGGSIGATLAPGEIIFEGDSMSLGMPTEAYIQPIDLGDLDQPLSALGNSPRDAISGSVLQPRGDAIIGSEILSTEESLPAPMPNQVRPMSYEWSGTDVQTEKPPVASGPVPVRRVPLPR